ncbi:MAG: MFS transporter [Candidatus Chloroheliales bacterium]|nr:MAG: MFS transporter [Chloroflexota bacterium]
MGTESEKGLPIVEVDAKPVANEAKPEAKLPPLWRNRDYMLLWSGQVVSSFGGGMSNFALPLLILAITGSPQAAGISGLAGSLPYAIFSLPVGALMDRWDRKRVMISCDLVRALNIATIPIALYFNVLTIWQIYINAFIEGSAFVFFNIAEVAALPRVVDKAQLPAASAQNSFAETAVGLISPPISGFLFKSISRVFPFIFDAVSYAASVISLSLIKTRFQMERVKSERNLRREIGEGLSWLWRQPVIRFMAFLSGFFNILSSANFLILILLAKERGADEPSIGLMFSISAVGGLIGAALGSYFQKHFSFGQVIIGTTLVQVLIYPLFLPAPNIIVIGVINAVIYMTVPIQIVTLFSYRLALIPDRLQGRVNSAVRLIAFSGLPIGSLVGGLLLQQIGTTNTIIVFSVWMLIVGLLAVFNPHLRNVPPIEQVQPVD